MYDVRIAWYFTPRVFAEVVAQAQDVRSATALHATTIAPRTGTLATQGLIGYQLNPWTVRYAGRSEGQQFTATSQLLPQQRTYFLKGSYYFQPERRAVAKAARPSTAAAAAVAAGAS